MKTNRIKRHKRIRRKIQGTTSVPRISVFRSNKNMQVQLIDDEANRTILGLSTTNMKTKGTKTDKAKALAELFAKKILELSKDKNPKVVFDRGGYKYHGRVKVFADILRENGLKF